MVFAAREHPPPHFLHGQISAFSRTGLFSFNFKSVLTCCFNLSSWNRHRVWKLLPQQVCLGFFRRDPGQGGLDSARQQQASRAAGLKVPKRTSISGDATHQVSNEPPERIQPGIVRGWVQMSGVAWLQTLEVRTFPSPLPPGYHIRSHLCHQGRSERLGVVVAMRTGSGAAFLG